MSPILIAACRLFIVDQLFWEDYLASNCSSRGDKGKSVHVFPEEVQLNVSVLGNLLLVAAILPKAFVVVFEFSH